MRGKFILFALACLLYIAGPASAAGNLLANGGFEGGSGDSPDAWTQDTWQTQAGATQFIFAPLGHAGRKAAGLDNVQPNDAKWVQKVAVKPKTVYRLSGFIMAEKADASMKGANLSVIGVMETSADFKDTNGKWKYVELYGKTGPKQEELQVAVRLGGYGSLTTGKAFFDDVALEEAGSVPDGVKPVSFEPKAAEAAPAKPGDKTAVSPFPLLFASLVFFLLFIGLYLGLIVRNGRAPQPGRKAELAFYAALAFALLLRLAIAPLAPGYPNDIASFKGWASQVSINGLTNFYDAGWADYPPGYIYVLYVIGKIQALFSIPWQSGAMQALVKLPAMLADLVSAVWIYRLGRKALGWRSGAAIALLFAFNPAVIVNSAEWGQIDSFFTLILVFALSRLAAGKLELSAVLFAVSVLIKPQALIFTPVFLFAAYRGGQFKRFWTSIALGLGSFVLLSLPFTLHKGLMWIVGLYSETLSQYAYATLNAFNLYALIGGNWVSNDNLLLSLPYKTWGLLFTGATVVLAIYFFFRKDKLNPAKIYLVSLILIVSIFMVSTKMHERYLFPALLLMLFALIETKDRRLLYIFVGFSITHYVNVAYVLYNGYLGQTGIDPLDGLLLLGSLGNVILFACLIKVVYDLLVKERPLPLADEIPPEALLAENGQPEPAGAGRFTRKDWLLMGAVTLLYAVIALYNLGSLKAPETEWKPANGGESFYLDLGESKTIERVNTFSGIGDGKYTIEFSDTPDNWSAAVSSYELNYTKVFLWNSHVVNRSARYVKFNVETPGFTLNELAFYEKDGKAPLPVKAVHTEGMSPALKGSVDNLFDEQGQAAYKPSYLNGTYFDEIYHARAAYEHLHNIKPYENTHPPFGKELIAVGIYLFGMNTFGWRIIGTLAGIAMLPVMYVFARRLFGRTEYAFLATLLFALDFMHFSQTRISTIDSYGVFFIMLMYYFMYRYFTLNFYESGLRKTLVPLFWSGLFFGIGAASKWIVIYGAAGLALLLFLSLYERYREYDAAKQLLKRDDTFRLDPALVDKAAHIRGVFLKYTAKTAAWCCLFFVLIPAVVYTLSFVPILKTPGEKQTVHQLVQYQKDMYDYHSKLKATHGFSSPWYEWPWIVKPIWFYSGQDQVGKDQVSTIVSMGNPAVWWLGVLAIPAAIYLQRKSRNKGMIVVLTAFFSQYVPWIIVPRLTFIYHYFAMVPFLILAIVYLCKKLIARDPKWKRWVYGYVGLAAALFVMFYPILSGMTVGKGYVTAFLRWFPTWYFYS